MSTLAITVVDKANATGATVAVSGTDSGTTNTVLLALADRAELGYATTAFTRTGDGDIDVPLGDRLTPASGVNLTDAWQVKVQNSAVAGLVSAAPTSARDGVILTFDSNMEGNDFNGLDVKVNGTTWGTDANINGTTSGGATFTITFIATPFLSSDTVTISFGDGAFNYVPSGIPINGVTNYPVPGTTPGPISASAVVTPTRGLLSPHFQAICALQRFMINLNLPDIGGKIYRCEWPGDFVSKIQRWPCVLLSPADAEDVGSQGSNQLTLWKFPVSVSIADNDGSWFEQTEVHLWMRWKMMGLFERRNPILFGNGQPGRIRRTTISPRSVVAPPSQEYQSFHSDFVITCECDRLVGPDATGN